MKAGSTTTNTTADTRLDPKALNHALSITGGATDTTDLTTGNIGVVTTPTEYDGTVNNGVKTAGGLSIQLAKDLKGITSIANGADGSGAKITLGTSGTTISGGDVSVSKNKITNLENGVADTDAATVGQMNTAIGNAKTKYYSVQGGPQIGSFNTNADNTGATASKIAGLAAGYETGTTGIASTVAGSYSGVMGSGLQGAAAVSLGTVNVNNNTDINKTASGVANSIIGQANMTKDSNASIIVGAGNSVKDSYRDLDTSALSNIKTAVGKKDATALETAVQSAVPKSGAQVMVMGGGNNITSAYMTQVIGVGNTVTGSNATYAEGTSTQYNYVDGSNNTLTNGKNDYIIGANNSVTGDSITTNQSNIVVGDNHTLSNKSNNVVIGSADSNKELAASDAVVLGHNADVTVNNGVALGSDSVASVKEGEKGYDPATSVTNKTTAPWTSTKAAVSVGKADGSVTRQITGVAAGTNDTDAVNVAQIKKLASIDASNIGKNYKDGDVTANEEAWGEALGTGSVASKDKKLVTGGTVYTETHPTDDGNYIKAADSAATNLSTLDTHVKANADKLSEIDGSSVKYDTNADKTVDKTKVTLAGEGGTTITNVKSALNGATDISKVTEGLTNAVNLSDLQTAYNALDQKASGAHTALTVEGKSAGTTDQQGNAVYNGGSLLLHESTDASTGKVTYDLKLADKISLGTSDADKIVIDGGDASTIKVGKNISLDGKNGKAYIAGVTIARLPAGELTYVDKDGKQVSGTTVTGGSYAYGLSNTSWNVDNPNYVKGRAATEDQLLTVSEAAKAAKTGLDTKANTDASNIGTHITDATKQQENLDKWGEALGTGSVDSTSNQLIKGSTVYNEVRPATKGNYIDPSQTTGANLTSLDTQVKNNADNISTIDGSSVKYDTNADKTVDKTKITLAGEGGTTITNLKDGVNNSDAATVGQLNDKISGVTYTYGDGLEVKDKTISVKAGNGITVDTNGVSVNTGNHLNINDGKVDVDDTGEVAEKGDKSQQLVTGKTVYDALHGGLDNITVGKDGKDGKDGSIGIAGKNGKDGYTMTIIRTEQGAAGVDGKDGITRVIYQDKDGKNKHTIATLDDGLKFKGDDSTVIAKKLDEQLDITGGADSTKLTDKNIGVNSDKGSLKIQLAKDLTGITSIGNQTTTDGKTTGAKVTLNADGSTDFNGGKITNIASNATKGADGKYTVADADKNNAASMSDVQNLIKDATDAANTGLAGKANVDASNIGTHITDATAQKTNLDKWGAAIGTGEVADTTNTHANQLVTGKTVYDALHGGLDSITVGKDGKDGKDGSIGIAGKDGKDGYTMTIIKTEQGAAGVDGKDGITRVVYQDKDGTNKHTVATLDDGLKFKGDDSTVITKKLDEQLDITGGADSTKLTDKNIGVNSGDNGSLKIQLAKDLTGITSISGSTDTNGAKITLDEKDKNISVNGGSIKDVASNLTKDGKLIDGSANNAASISDVQTLVQQGVDNGYTNGDGITIQKDQKTNKNVISINKGDGLKFDNGKLAVNTGDGLAIDETTKALKIKTSDSNLKVDQNGIGLNHVITIGTAGKDAHPITIDGTKGEVSGLTNTTWDSKANYSSSTRAATESQVAQAMSAAVDQAGANDTHVAAGSYAVNDKNQVSMNLVDKNNNNKGTVTITDVAKASEMGDVSKLADGVKNADGKKTTVVDAINNVNTKIGDQKYSQSNTSGSNKYVQDGDSITSAIGKLDGAIQTVNDASSAANNIKGDSNIAVTDITDDNGKVTGHQVSLNKDISVDSVKAKTTTTDTLTVNKSATIGGVTIKDQTISGLKDTEIKEGSTDAVNAGTIWKEVRPSSDGSYISKDKTTGDNLSALDTQVKKTADLINSDGKTIKIGGSDSATKIDVSDKDGNGRTITGVVTDGSDASSAANVGYVNDVAAANTQQIYRDMNSAYGHLNNNINKAAAGSNALAALHPLDYDPADKASYAVGYGHYRNANAAAVGAFYQPNANTMVSVGVSMGNGDPGVNAGVSFKVGKGSAYNGVSKAQMAETIASQQKQISEIKASDAAKDQRIDTLEKENQEMKKQIQEILAKLGK